MRTHQVRLPGAKYRKRHFSPESTSYRGPQCQPAHIRSAWRLVRSQMLGPSSQVVLLVQDQCEAHCREPVHTRGGGGRGRGGGGGRELRCGRARGVSRKPSQPQRQDIYLLKYSTSRSVSSMSTLSRSMSLGRKTSSVQRETVSHDRRPPLARRDQHTCFAFISTLGQRRAGLSRAVNPRSLEPGSARVRAKEPLPQARRRPACGHPGLCRPSTGLRPRDSPGEGSRTPRSVLRPAAGRGGSGGGKGHGFSTDAVSGPRSQAALWHSVNTSSIPETSAPEAPLGHSRLPCCSGRWPRPRLCPRPAPSPCPHPSVASFWSL